MIPTVHNGWDKFGDILGNFLKNCDICTVKIYLLWKLGFTYNDHAFLLFLENDMECCLIAMNISVDHKND